MPLAHGPAPSLQIELEIECCSLFWKEFSCKIIYSKGVITLVDEFICQNWCNLLRCHKFSFKYWY